MPRLLFSTSNPHTTALQQRSSTTPPHATRDVLAAFSAPLALSPSPSPPLALAPSTSAASSSSSSSAAYTATPRQRRILAPESSPRPSRAQLRRAYSGRAPGHELLPDSSPVQQQQGKSACLDDSGRAASSAVASASSRLTCALAQQQPPEPLAAMPGYANGLGKAPGRTKFTSASPEKELAPPPTCHSSSDPLSAPFSAAAINSRSASQLPSSSAASGTSGSSSSSSRIDLSAYRYNDARSGSASGTKRPAPLPRAEQLREKAEMSDSSVELVDVKAAPPKPKKRRFVMGGGKARRGASDSDSDDPIASPHPEALASPAAASAVDPEVRKKAQRLVNVLGRSRGEFDADAVAKLMQTAKLDVGETLELLKRDGQKAVWPYMPKEKTRSSASGTAESQSSLEASGSTKASSTASVSAASREQQGKQGKQTVSYVSLTSPSPSPVFVHRAHSQQQQQQQNGSASGSVAAARTAVASPTFKIASRLGVGAAIREASRTAAPASARPLSRPAPLQQGKAMQTVKKGQSSSRAVSISDDEDDGQSDGGYGSGDQAKRSNNAFEWFAQAEKGALMDTMGCDEEIAEKIIALRPFRNVDDVYRKLDATPKLSRRLYDNCESLMASYRAVDNVLAKCEKTGAMLQREIGSWDTANGAAAPSSGYLSKQPEHLKEGTVLKDFQLYGVNWLRLLWSKKLGGILADEMGTGKTCQVIAFLTHELAQPGKRRTHLIVVPSSVLENWEREFAQFAPHIALYTYRGNQKERAEMREELREDKEAGEEREYEVVLASYDSVISAQDYTFFRKFGWAASVFDEGHVLKNKNSSKYGKLIRIRTQWRLLLTGTPLQNNLAELMSLLNFILEDFFGSAAEDLEGIFKNSSKPQNILSTERIARAKGMLGPFVLRRRKALVLPDLPPKVERVEMCDMTATQREHYSRIFAHTKAMREEARAAAAAAKGKGARGKAAVPETKPGGSSHVLMELRKAANHPLNFRTFYDAAKLDRLAREYCKDDPERNLTHVREDFEINSDAELNRSIVAGLPRLRGGPLDLPRELWLDSCKIVAMKRIIDDVRAKGERAVIFSQFVTMLDIIVVALEHLGIKYRGFTGETKVDERQSIVDEFTSDETIDVFLLSTGAGGVGINLTAANHVIIYDSDFNPQNDKQAEDRCYRIGQRRPVTVTRLVARGTIDEHIIRLGAKKLSLAEQVEGGGQANEDEESKAQQEDAEGKVKELRDAVMQRIFEE